MTDGERYRGNGFPPGWLAHGLAKLAGAFTVTLQPANATLTATVHYKAVGLTGTAGSDFAATEGTLTFSPGETLKTITVPVFGDMTPEGNETFVVQLSDAVNAVLQNDTAFGTIVDDDKGSPPTRDRATGH